MLQAHLSVHACVGVVTQPSRGILQGDAVWSCRLLLTQVGISAVAGARGKTICQETYALRCRGALATQYCVDNLQEGSLVHVVSKLIQRPQYVPIHGGYELTTELLVSDNFGFVTKVASL